METHLKLWTTLSKLKVFELYYYVEKYTWLGFYSVSAIFV